MWVFIGLGGRRTLINRHVPLELGGILHRCLVSQGTVRAFGIVLSLLERAQGLGLSGALEVLQVQELVTQFAVERLRVAVLPRAPRGDV